MGKRVQRSFKHVGLVAVLAAFGAASGCMDKAEAPPSEAARAKGEEGQLATPPADMPADPQRPVSDEVDARAAASTAAPAADGRMQGRAKALKEAQEFGMIGVLEGKSNAPAPPPGAGYGVRPTGLGNADPFAKSRGGSGAVSLVDEDQRAPVPVEETAIDPNARFATTYRPGGGHLAAFESAVARGIVTNADRELVSDLGARYAVTMDAPTDRALGFRGAFEREKLAPSGGTVHVRLDLQSIDKSAAERPRLSVVVVLDVSGSMAGELIQSARQAASALVDKLDANDDFSLVTFSTGAEVKIPIGRVGTRKPDLKKTIAGITENGGTNIGEGLRLGYEQANDKKLSDDAVKVVFLLSDGRANDGITNRNALSKLANDAFQQGIQTSSFGLGSDYDGPLMSSIANDGAGGYYYLRDGEQIAPALATELEKRLDPVATALEMRVRLKPGVELLNVYGSRRLNEVEASRVRAIEVAQDKQAAAKDKIKTNREEDVEGGMRFFIPAYARNDAHSILLKLRVPEGVGAKEIALVELKYKDRIFKKNAADEIPLKVSYADSDADSARTIDMSVARTVQGFAAGETLMKAANAIANGDRASAAKLLAEREGLLHHAATSLGEPLFVMDAMRLARLRLNAGDARGQDPLTLAMVMETAGNVHLH